MRIAVVNGPNLNLLGEREPAVYGSSTLADLEAAIEAYARERDIEVRFAQHNSEGAIIDELHALRRWADGIVINPAAYTHYSYAIRDAIAAISVPTVEVHLSDISQREAFRRVSVTHDACIAQISGLGFDSYLRGIDELVRAAKASA
ncbi:MAG: type II 3-dehydroquinate dehydratase [Candidatus Velthaea sp.]